MLLLISFSTFMLLDILHVSNPANALSPKICMMPATSGFSPLLPSLWAGFEKYCQIKKKLYLEDEKCIREQGSTNRRAPGLVNFVPALAYLFCLNLPAAFTQPGAAY